MTRRADHGMLLWIGLVSITCLGAGFAGGLVLHRLTLPRETDPETLAAYLDRLDGELDLNVSQQRAIRKALDGLAGEIEKAIAEQREEVRGLCTRLRRQANEQIRSQLDDGQRRIFDGR